MAEESGPPGASEPDIPDTDSSPISNIADNLGNMNDDGTWRREIVFSLKKIEGSLTDIKDNSVTMSSDLSEINGVMVWLKEGIVEMGTVIMEGLNKFADKFDEAGDHQALRSSRENMLERERMTEASRAGGEEGFSGEKKGFLSKLMMGKGGLGGIGGAIMGFLASPLTKMAAVFGIVMTAGRFLALGIVGAIAVVALFAALKKVTSLLEEGREKGLEGTELAGYVGRELLKSVTHVLGTIFTAIGYMTIGEDKTETIANELEGFAEASMVDMAKQMWNALKVAVMEVIPHGDKILKLLTIQAPGDEVAQQAAAEIDKLQESYNEIEAKNQDLLAKINHINNELIKAMDSGNEAYFVKLSKDRDKFQEQYENSLKQVEDAHNDLQKKQVEETLRKGKERGEILEKFLQRTFVPFMDWIFYKPLFGDTAKNLQDDAAAQGGWMNKIFGEIGDYFKHQFKLIQVDMKIWFNDQKEMIREYKDSIFDFFSGIKDSMFGMVDKLRNFDVSSIMKDFYEAIKSKMSSIFTYDFWFGDPRKALGLPPRGRQTSDSEPQEALPEVPDNSKIPPKVFTEQYKNPKSKTFYDQLQPDRMIFPGSSGEKAIHSGVVNDFMSIAPTFLGNKDPIPPLNIEPQRAGETPSMSLVQDQGLRKGTVQVVTEHEKLESMTKESKTNENAAPTNIVRGGDTVVSNVRNTFSGYANAHQASRFNDTKTFRS